MRERPRRCSLADCPPMPIEAVGLVDAADMHMLEIYWISGTCDKSNAAVPLSGHALDYTARVPFLVACAQLIWKFTNAPHTLSCRDKALPPCGIRGSVRVSLVGRYG